MNRICDKVALVMIGVGVLLACSSARAAPPAEAAICSSCHGANGMGNAGAGFPALAGLPASYLAAQMMGFQKGTRVNPMMSGVVANLTIAQINSIVAYYAALPLPQTPEPTPLPAGSGAVLAIDGDWNHSTAGIPACDSCHGPYGLGVGQRGAAACWATQHLYRGPAWGLAEGRPQGRSAGPDETCRRQADCRTNQCGCELLRGAFAEPAGLAETRRHGVGQMSYFSRAVVPLFAALSAFVAPASVALAQETAPKLIPFTPPPDSAMPRGPLGDAVRLGQNVFRYTTTYAGGVIGAKLNCTNCHLGGGSIANSGPLWAAYPAYPEYRGKNKRVNDYVMRLQDCFRFSENGKVVPADASWRSSTTSRGNA